MFVVQDWPDVSFFSIIIVGTGFFSLVVETVFSSKSHNEPRAISIKKQSGYMAYLYNLAYVFLVVLLLHFNIIKALLALKFILAGSILLMPIFVLYYNKKM
jgi:hypothetical protein